MRLPLTLVGSIFFLVVIQESWAQNSYSLHQALQTARQNNQFLKTERFNLNIAESDIVTARLRPNPILNNQTLQLADRKFFPDNTQWNNARNRQVWWQLTKPIQWPNQRRYKIELAQQNSQLTSANYAETERNLFLDVATRWLAAWSAQKQYDLINIAKTNTDSLLKINQLRLKNQVISQTDVIRTELLAEQYALQLKIARQEWSNRSRELSLVLGLRDSVIVDLTDTLAFSGDVKFDSLMNYALNHRADLVSAQTAIQVFNSNIKLQHSMAWPIPEIGAIWNPQNTIPYLGFFGTIRVPLFDRNQGERQKSQVLRQQADQALIGTQRQIETEIITSYNRFKTDQDNLQKFSNILNQSETILNNVRYAYLRGGTTIVDFLEAQRSWLETRQQYFATLQQYRQSYVDLLFDSGLINQLAQ